jgi:hypothetical protein
MQYTDTYTRLNARQIQNIKLAVKPFNTKYGIDFIIPHTDFHVRMDENYVATVRDFRSLLNYLFSRKIDSNEIQILNPNIHSKNLKGTSLTELADFKNTLDKVISFVKDKVTVIKEPHTYPEWKEWDTMTEKQQKAEFNLYWDKGTTVDVQESISKDLHKYRQEMRSKYNHPGYLLTHIGDGYLVLVEGGRGIEDMFATDTVTKKETYEAYAAARKEGLKTFTVDFVTSYYWYNDREHRFSGELPEHTGTGESYIMVSYTPGKKYYK